MNYTRIRDFGIMSHISLLNILTLTSHSIEMWRYSEVFARILNSPEKTLSKEIMFIFGVILFSDRNYTNTDFIWWVFIMFWWLLLSFVVSRSIWCDHKTFSSIELTVVIQLSKDVVRQENEKSSHMEWTKQKLHANYVK